ncbi:MAG TPA: hypothetical protein VH637_16640 [Streptosporangiaceae bacterium]
MHSGNLALLALLTSVVLLNENPPANPGGSLDHSAQRRPNPDSPAGWTWPHARHDDW